MKAEIEVKLLLTPEIARKVGAWLRKNAQEKGKIHHIETYFNNPANSFIFTAPEGYKDALDYLRIRFTDKGDSICLKRWHRDQQTGKTTHCDEFETPVTDGRVLSELLVSLGFTDNTIVDKTRTLYDVPGFEIAIDEVKGLGKFMEVEAKTEFSDPKEGLQAIWEFLRQLGIKKYSRMDRGYVSMLWNPDYDFGEEVIL